MATAGTVCSGAGCQDTYRFDKKSFGGRVLYIPTFASKRLLKAVSRRSGVLCRKCYSNVTNEHYRSIGNVRTFVCTLSVHCLYTVCGRAVCVFQAVLTSVGCNDQAVSDDKENVPPRTLNAGRSTVATAGAAVPLAPRTTALADSKAYVCALRMQCLYVQFICTDCTD